MVSANQALAAIQVGAKVLDKRYDRQQLAPARTIALLAAFKRTAGVRDDLLHLFRSTIIVRHALHLTQHCANSKC